ncbi:M50 family metallopeptidase [Paenibacillus sp. FJAT-26967]|uniref:M50 family metallopeptidase n=1 Tax=Paenibacillus sp. FJAT-26967 TaxID=1729690 RepID=UPI0020A4DF83|nr:M50 family metallopeptidase [Paenibacillus sp. FJAT-26967]
MSKWLQVRFRFHPLFTIVMLLSLATGHFLESATLFGIVFLHELGHYGAAAAFGWRVREIRLLPFGGVLIVDELASVPSREEMIVALAGPLQHVWLIALGLLCQSLAVGDPVWWQYFIEVNVMIGLFNLLPILPLDGGKLLQGVLGEWIPYQRTIVYAAWTSMVLSLLVTVWAVWPSGSGHIEMNLLMIGLFLFYQNWVHRKQLPYHFLRFLMNRQKVSERLAFMGTHARPIVVSGQRGIGEVVKLFMREKYHLIYIVGNQGRIQGTLPEQKLVDSYLLDKNRSSTVSDLLT